MKAVRSLAESDDPRAALFELETFINGIYRTVQNPLIPIPVEVARARVEPILPVVQDLRATFGWLVRDLDIGVLREIRRSSALSMVLGAGTSMGAGAPSWSELVRLLLEQTLEKGLELREMIPAADNPGHNPADIAQDGSLRLASGSWSFESRIREVKRYSPEQETVARSVLNEVRAGGANTDVERLMQGAQVVYDLCGQYLFQLLTGILYSRAKSPSATHRAIASLARPQVVPSRRGSFPGWDSIVTYNFDGLMSEALAEEQIPSAAWAMKDEELRGDPDTLARNSDWHVPIFHLHGYTPRRPFLITHVHFVFSTSQYLTTYKGSRSAVLNVVYERYLANPVHVAVYVGCSFADRSMNDLLKAAFDEYPGRYHYALLKWPRKRRGAEPDAAEIGEESARYLAFGVRPVWFDDHAEIPDLIRALL